MFATPVNNKSATICRMATLAERINEAMDESGHSISSVAEHLGISYQAVRKWVLGESLSISGEHLVNFCELTGYSPRWIISERGPKILHYAKNPAQEKTLLLMESLPIEAQTKIPEIGNLFAEHKQKAVN